MQEYSWFKFTNVTSIFYQWILLIFTRRNAVRFCIILQIRNSQNINASSYTHLMSCKRNDLCFFTPFFFLLIYFLSQLKIFICCRKFFPGTLNMSSLLFTTIFLKSLLLLKAIVVNLYWVFSICFLLAAILLELSTCLF